MQLRPTQQVKQATRDFKSTFLKSAVGSYMLNITDCGNYRVQGELMQAIFPIVSVSFLILPIASNASIFYVQAISQKSRLVKFRA